MNVMKSIASLILTLGTTLLVTSVSHSAQAVEGNYMSLGVGQLSISGDQANGSGFGYVLRTQGFNNTVKGSSFAGGAGVEMKNINFKNERSECCFGEDKTLSVSDFGINLDLMWSLWRQGLLGFEVGIHTLQIEQGSEESQNYGTTKLAAIAQQELGNRFNIAALLEYYFPVNEKSGGESYSFAMTGASVAVGYLFGP